ncbi:uncharacterized protein F5Z01DRAFT_147185 [Emericellopsis atlantica]|uniref:DUF6604 domain-containing protein n=1 Tax=Emericellopsis atlantica TaxID=2614577 RepID=A0A9P8CNY9_9HYPO|nr:uncharacterized protein F5Z01DRAFT_147185 [Emericellopsis atlantica]KAG9253575.1 hypothetical protein F5Z01DRAFT_147185 [Emericellopsis atlantica]
MLPSQLLGTYRQYKRDTDSVASWLASTAKASGFPADLLTAPGGAGGTQAPNSGRLKGKERAKARGSGKQSTSKPAESKVAKHIIAIKDFLPLAQWIAGRQNPAISVPDVFSATIDRLITLRSEFNGKLSEHGVETDTKSDERHGYFVGVLEAVRAAVCPRGTPTTATAAANAAIDSANDASQAPGEDLGGRFAALTVDEPSQAFIEVFRNAPHERPEPRNDDPASYEAEPQTSLEDTLFAFFVMIDDLNRIRSRIEWIWSNHRDGMFDLAAAAVATNTAISLARSLIDEVKPIFDKQEGGAWGLLNKLFFATCLRKGHQPEEIYLGGSKDNFNYNLYDTADECYLVAFRHLTSFVDVLDPKCLPLIKEGMFGTYDASSDRSSKTGPQRHQEDQVLLLEFFTELVTVNRLLPGYPVEDEFLRGMKELEKTGTVTFSLVFAAQIFLDIHHTMRAAVRRSFATMFEETTVMHNTLQAHLDFHKNLKIKNWPASNDHVLRELSRMLDWMGKDPVHGAKAKQFTRMKRPVPPEMEVHRIMIYSPILAGLYLFRIRAQVYEAGVAVANAWGSITYSAHIYNALLQQGLVEGRWEDMDVFLTNMGDANFWTGGERPQTMQDCFQKFCLQMGVSAAAFTKNRRRQPTVASRAGPRGIKEGAPVSSMLATKICNKADMDWTLDLIDNIVARSAYKMEGSLNDGDLTMALIDDAQELKARDRLRQQKAKARASGKDKTTLVPEELVETLALSLNSESLEMSFPLLFMHRWCWRVLRSIKESCDPVLRERYTPAYMDKESELPWVAGYILMSASGFEGSHDLRLLRLAADPLNEMLGVGGGRMAIKLLRDIGKHIEFEEEHSEGE